MTDQNQQIDTRDGAARSGSGNGSFAALVVAMAGVGLVMGSFGVVVADARDAGASPVATGIAPLLIALAWLGLAVRPGSAARVTARTLWWAGLVALVLAGPALALPAGARVLVVAALYGLGSGASVLLVPVAAHRLAGLGADRQRRLMWVNAAAIGAALVAPGAMAWLLAHDLQAYGWTAAALLVALAARPPAAVPPGRLDARPSLCSGPWLFVVAVVGLELVVSFWAVAWLVARGVAGEATEIGWVLSLYFAGMMSGRVAMAGLGHLARASTVRVVPACLLVAGAGGLLAASAGLPLAAAGLAVAGLGVGPLYPIALDRLFLAAAGPVAASSTGLSASATAIGAGPGVLGVAGAGLGLVPAGPAVFGSLLVLSLALATWIRPVGGTGRRAGR